MRGVGQPDQRSFAVETTWHSFVPQNVASAAKWLMAETRFAYLLYFCLLKLGRPATGTDAEETLQEFLHKSLQKVCRLHQPKKGSFWTYFLKALQNECRRQSQRLRRRASRERPFHEGADRKYPSAALSTAELLDQGELRKRLERLGQELDERAWHAIQLHHFENRTVEEIAAQIGESVANVKVLLFRGRHELGELLRLESCSLVRPAHVRNWPRLCEVLYAEADLKRSCVAGALWSVLDSDVRDRVQRVATTGTGPADHDAAAIISCLNRVLPQDKLWPTATLTTLRRQPTFPAEAALLLRKRRLDAITRLRLNRLILEFGLPGIIAISDPGATDYEPHRE